MYNRIMKKILAIIFTLISFNCFAIEKTTTFTNEIFKKAQSEGKTVVINSWNKTCYTCGKQIKILDEYDVYLKFFEKYFSSKEAKPLKKGKELARQIFG